MSTKSRVFFALVMAVAAVTAAQTWVELPTTIKVPVLVHTPEAFAEELADTVTERLAVMLDERERLPDVDAWETWHLQLMEWNLIRRALDGPGGDLPGGNLDLRAISEWMP